MARAFSDERLGEQTFHFIKPLPYLMQKSKSIPCIDVIVVKKYPMYFIEDATTLEGRRKLTRSKRSIERLRTLRMVSLEEQFQRDFEKRFPEQGPIFD